MAAAGLAFHCFLGGFLVKEDDAGSLGGLLAVAIAHKNEVGAFGDEGALVL